MLFALLSHSHHFRSTSIRRVVVDPIIRLGWPPAAELQDVCVCRGDAQAGRNLASWTPKAQPAWCRWGLRHRRWTYLPPDAVLWDRPFICVCLAGGRYRDVVGETALCLLHSVWQDQKGSLRGLGHLPVSPAGRSVTLVRHL